MRIVSKTIFLVGIIILWGFVIFQLLSGKVGKIEITIGVLAIFMWFIIKNFEERFDDIEERIASVEHYFKNGEQNEKEN